jgi:hypothetical protein
MPKKEAPDQREYWRWYERTTNIGDGFPATPPPVSEGDGSQPVHLRGALRYLCKLSALVVGFIWALLTGARW